MAEISNIHLQAAHTSFKHHAGPVATIAEFQMFSHLWSCHSKSQRKANQTYTELVVPVASESRCGHTKRQPSNPSCQRMLANGGICLSWDRMIPLLLAVIPHNYYLSISKFNNFSFVSFNSERLLSMQLYCAALELSLPWQYQHISKTSKVSHNQT